MSVLCYCQCQEKHTLLLSVSREVHTVTVSVKRSTHCYCQWNAHESPMEINPATPRAYRWGWFLPEEHQAAAASSGWRQTQTQTRLHCPSCHQMRGQWAPSVPHVQCAGDTRNPWGYPSPRWRSPASAEYVCQRQGFHPACCLWHCWTLSCWVQPALRRLKEWKVAVKEGPGAVTVSMHMLAVDVEQDLNETGLREKETGIIFLLPQSLL